jgi:para-nitrobenzyl esterase
MQATSYVQMRFRSEMSEDCLYLNIWAPADARNGAKLPVMIWIYGGGFTAGSGSEYRYDGANLAANGIMVVTVNYRVGVFGFLAHPALTAETGASGNYAFLDQLAAISWTHANIAAFGGDPERITIAGESAGSHSVSVLMASPMARNLYARAIGESGAGLSLPGRAEAEEAGMRFAERLGAKDTAALRAIPADMVLAEALARDGHFGPIVDGRILVEQPIQTFQAGREAHVPLLVGSNSEEASAASVLGIDQPWTKISYRSALLRLYGPKADAVEALYPATTNVDVRRAATDLGTDRFIANSTWSWMDLHRRTGAPTYYYYYDHIRPQPVDTDWRLPIQPQIGALHGSELEYVFRNIDFSPAWSFSDEDRRISTAMSAYWIAFVKTGDPNHGDSPKWAQEPAQGDTLTRHRLGDNNADELFPGQTREKAMADLMLSRNP